MPVFKLKTFFRTNKQLIRGISIGILSTTIIISMLAIGKSLFLGNNSECKNNYQYINNAGCQLNTGIRKSEYKEFRLSLEAFRVEQIASGKVTNLSVYFRDLKGGPTFGIEEKEKFVPASLMKVPLLMAYYELSESDNDLLNKKLRLGALPSLREQSIPVKDPVQVGVEYSVEELLEKMIINSDNVAYGILYQYLENTYPSQKLYTQTLINMGLTTPQSPLDETISVKTYASIFRQLYQFSYLSPEMSDKALSLLTKSTYDQALVAGLPKDILVAHKFGERNILNNDNKQLHDCGIIYYPDNPYILCVMSTGTDFNVLSEVIKTVSQKVYQEIDSRRVN